MAHALEKEVEQLLQQGLGKREIQQRLASERDPRQLVFFLNNAALPARRNRYQYVNLLLAVLLAFFTFKKLLVAFSFGAFDLYLLLALVVPVINIYLLREILRFHRLAYQFLMVLALLALLQPENHRLQELLLLLSQAGLAAFLFGRLFPRQELLPMPE